MPAQFCRTFAEEVNRRAPGCAAFHRSQMASEFIERRQSVDLMLSTNMHPIILASTAGAPSIALSYHYKLDDYMKSIGLEQNVRRIDDFDSAGLASLMRDAIERRDELARTVKQKHAEVRQLAQRNGDLLASVLEERAEEVRLGKWLPPAKVHAPTE